MRQLREWHKGQPLSAAHLNEVIYAVREMMPGLGDLASTPNGFTVKAAGQEFRVDFWIGKVRDRGPSDPAQNEPSGAAYWVRRLFITDTNADQKVEADFDSAPLDADERPTADYWVKVHNLAEYEADTHLLYKGRVVQVFTLFTRATDEAGENFNVVHICFETPDRLRKGLVTDVLADAANKAYLIKCRPQDMAGNFLYEDPSVKADVQTADPLGKTLTGLQVEPGDTIVWWARDALAGELVNPTRELVVYEGDAERVENLSDLRFNADDFDVGAEKSDVPDVYNKAVVDWAGMTCEEGNYAGYNAYHPVKIIRFAEHEPGTVPEGKLPVQWSATYDAGSRRFTIYGVVDDTGGGGNGGGDGIIYTADELWIHKEGNQFQHVGPLSEVVSTHEGTRVAVNASDPTKLDITPVTITFDLRGHRNGGEVGETIVYDPLAEAQDRTDGGKGVDGAIVKNITIPKGTTPGTEFEVPGSLAGRMYELAFFLHYGATVGGAEAANENPNWPGGGNIVGCVGSNAVLADDFPLLHAVGNQGENFTLSIDKDTLAVKLVYDGPANTAEDQWARVWIRLSSPFTATSTS